MEGLLVRFSKQRPATENVYDQSLHSVRQKKEERRYEAGQLCFEGRAVDSFLGGSSFEAKENRTEEKQTVLGASKEPLASKP